MMNFPADPMRLWVQWMMMWPVLLTSGFYSVPR